MGIWPINDVFGLSAVKKNYNIFFYNFFNNRFNFIIFHEKINLKLNLLNLYR
jgi:hypothetical protein